MKFYQKDLNHILSTFDPYLIYDYFDPVINIVIKDGYFPDNCIAYKLHYQYENKVAKTIITYSDIQLLNLLTTLLTSNAQVI